MKKGLLDSGFTLVEVFITIIVVGIIAAIAVQVMIGPIEKARAAEARKNLSCILEAEKLYYFKNGTFAKGDWGALNITNPNTVPDRRYEYSHRANMGDDPVGVLYEALPYNDRARTSCWAEVWSNGDVKFLDECPLIPENH